MFVVSLSLVSLFEFAIRSSSWSAFVTRLGNIRVPTTRCRCFGEEICNQLDGGLWILLHDPVPGVGHDAARDVAGGEPHLIGDTLAEKLLGTDGKHRHRDLAALGE